MALFHYIDDNESDRYLFDILVGEHFAVETFSSFEEYEKHLKKDDISYPDALFLDILLRGEDNGISDLIKLKLNPDFKKFKDIPVIMLSGTLDELVLGMCMKQGARACIQKPLVWDDDFVNLLEETISYES